MNSNFFYVFIRVLFLIIIDWKKTNSARQTMKRALCTSGMGFSSLFRHLPDFFFVTTVVTSPGVEI